MTLIMGMSKAEGIYMSVDHRVTNGQTGAILDDAAPKHLTVYYPPAGEGPKALFGYTGVAVLPDGTRTGDWLRETLRGGEAESIEQSMAHLGERLNRDYARFRQLLVVNVLSIEPSGRRAFGEFCNLRPTALGKVVDAEFHLRGGVLGGPFAFFNGSGFPHIGAKNYALLERQLTVWPNRPLDHMNLLSKINRAVATRVPSVSPFAHVAFVNADERTAPQAYTFVERGEMVPAQLPYLLAGHDLSVVLGAVMAEHANRRPGAAPTPLDVDELNRLMRRRE